MDLSNEDIAIFKECFNNISVRELNQRIEFYRRSIDFRTISEERLKSELRKLFSVELNNENVSFFLKTDTLTGPYQLFHFYRIRKFEKGDYDELQNKYFPSMRHAGHAWAKPKSLVNTYGRLHRPNQSVLYAASKTTNAIYETELKLGEFFFLLVYESSARMRVSQVHTVPYMEEFTEEENAKRIILHNFLLSEFTKYVPTGREYLYKSSLAIYEEFFFSPLIDAFCYPSVKSESNTGYNICFDQDRANEKLKFLGVMVCAQHPSNGDSEFQIELYYNGFLNKCGNFDFFPPNSEIARERFGDFSMIREMGL